MAKNKMITCKDCGQEISGSAKACPHCGAEQKKPFYKKAWFWIVIVLIAAMGSGGETTDHPDTTQPSVQSVVETTVASTEAQVTESTIAATEEVTVPTTEISATEQVSAETVAALIRATAADSFTNFDLQYDETGITINIWEEGIAVAATLAASGNDEFLQAWNELVNNVVYFGEAITELAMTLGRDDLVISVNVLNDQNKDNVLVFVMNGIMVYDAVNNAA